jgi:5-methylcytosine-specific restriction endonuclease McrA
MRVDPDLRARIRRQKRAAEDRRLQRIAQTPNPIDVAAYTRLRDTAERCAICQRTLDHDMPGSREPTIDHIVPLAAGGLHELSNLRVVCRACNIMRPKDGRDLH